MNKYFSISWVKSLLLYAATFAVFGVLFTKIDFSQFVDTVKTAKFNYFFAAVVVSCLINFFVGPYIWSIILKYMGYAVPLKKLIFAVIASGPLRSVMPLKSGEILKAVYLTKKFNVPAEQAVSSVLFDKITNLFGLLGLIGIVSCAQGMYLLGTSSLLLMIAVIYASELSAKFYGEKINSLNIDGFFGRFLKSIVVSFSEIRMTGKLNVTLLSMLFQLSHIINAYLLFKSLSLDIPLSSIFFWIPVVVLITNLPVTVAGLGTREACVMVFFSSYGLAANLFGAGLLISFVEYILPLAAGCVLIKKFLRDII